MSEQLNSLYEELICLDEIAGELSPEDNARVDQRRKALVQMINNVVKEQQA
jgi:hypothetical protein